MCHVLAHCYFKLHGVAVLDQEASGGGGVTFEPEKGRGEAGTSEGEEHRDLAGSNCWTIITTVRETGYHICGWERGMGEL